MEETGLPVAELHEVYLIMQQVYYALKIRPAPVSRRSINRMVSIVDKAYRLLFIADHRLDFRLFAVGQIHVYVAHCSCYVQSAASAEFMIEIVYILGSFIAEPFLLQFVVFIRPIEVYQNIRIKIVGIQMEIRVVVEYLDIPVPDKRVLEMKIQLLVRMLLREILEKRRYYQQIA